MLRVTLGRILLLSSVLPLLILLLDQDEDALPVFLMLGPLGGVLYFWGRSDEKKETQQSIQRLNTVGCDLQSCWFFIIPTAFLGGYPGFIGTALYGSCDSSDTKHGEVYVATKFFYVFLLPLVPLRSYAITESRENVGFGIEDDWFGVPIDLYWKSVFLAWFRILRLIIYIFCACAILFTALGMLSSGNIEELATALVFSIVVWLVLRLSRRLDKPSSARKKYLNDLLG